MIDKIVTIHQPDFMPWLGLFNKINKADELIVLDHVTNNPKDAAFWCRRVKMLIGGKEHWMSVSLKKGNQPFIPIKEMKMEMDIAAVKKFIKSVEINYKKAPFFNEMFYLVEYYFQITSTNLSERNMWFIKEVMSKLSISTPISLSSELDPQFTSNELLIDLLKKRNASVYLCGGGAASYQNDALFFKENIQVVYNQFDHPVYEQFNSDQFVKGLSIIDVLMNVGFLGTSKLLKLK